jgi:imidazolonepropionase-like amidohydrolase
LQRERRRILLGAAIAIDGERIASVGELATLRVAHPDAEEFDGHGMVAIPGLIDTHAQPISRSSAASATLCTGTPSLTT